MATVYGNHHIALISSPQEDMITLTKLKQRNDLAHILRFWIQSQVEPIRASVPWRGFYARRLPSGSIAHCSYPRDAANSPCVQANRHPSCAHNARILPVAINNSFALPSAANSFGFSFAREAFSYGLSAGGETTEGRNVKVGWGFRTFPAHMAWHIHIC